jgi:hypothetical protein
MSNEITAPEAEVNPYVGLPPEELVDKLCMAKDLISEHNATSKMLEEDKKAIEAALIYHHLQHPTCKRVGTDNMTVAFSEETVFNPTDWEQAFDYIIENRAFYLMMRKLNNAPLREMQAMGQLPAFVEPYTRVKISTSKPRKARG